MSRLFVGVEQDEPSNIFAVYADDIDEETVNHKDGNKKNNHISNLEWMTQYENTLHAINNGLRKSNFNIKSLSIPVEKRDDLGSVISKYPSIGEAARKTGNHGSSISRSIRKGYKCGGYNWFKTK